MTDHRIALELDMGRESAEKPGSATLTATTTIAVNGELEAHPDGGGGLLGRIRGWNGYEVVRAEIQLPGVDEAEWNNALGIVDSFNQWFVLGLSPGVLPDWFLNSRPIGTASWQNANGYNIVEPAIQIDGLALAQVNGATEFRGLVELRRLLASRTSGQLLVGDFVSSNQLGPSNFDVGPFVSARMQAVRFGTAPVDLGPKSDDTRDLVHQCTATFSDPWARVWVGPGDIGIAPEQLPPDLVLISGDKLKRFPSIFVRRTELVRGLRAATSASMNPVNVPQSGPLVLVTQRPPTHSRWRLWIDGRMADVVLEHPEGSDLRTPKAVWNAVIASRLLGASVTEPWPTFRAEIELTGRAFYQWGVIGRDSHLEAAEFVEFLDEDLSSISVEQDPNV